MGLIDTLSDVGDGIKSYFDERFGSVRKAYADAWTKDISTGWSKLYSGALTMTMSGAGGRDPWWKGFTMFMDGMVGTGGAVLKGTVGGLFEAPALHELGWTLDKAYRYAWAYPVSWMFTTSTASALEADAARKSGGDGVGTFLRSVMDRQPFGAKGIWSEDVRNVTPGQAIVWSVAGLVGGGLAYSGATGTRDDFLQFAREYDPRTMEGQEAFAGKEANFLLKYTSGTLDMASVIAVDPSRGAATGLKAARARFTNVATPAYVRGGGVEREVSSAQFERVYEVARHADTPEAFRERVMPNAFNGGTAAVTLWAAAQISKDVFRDAYVVARGLDGLYSDKFNPRSLYRDPSGAGSFVTDDALYRRTDQENPEGFRTATDSKPAEPGGMRASALGKGKPGAIARLRDKAPAIASDLARHLGAWSVGEDAIAFGYDPVATKSMQVLARTDVDAYIAAMEEGRGKWGDLPGSLAGVPQPKVSWLRDKRIQFHDWATAPRREGSTLKDLERMPNGIRSWAAETGRVHIGRFVRPFMPSHGHAAFLDAADGSVSGLKHFKALLERAGLRPDRVEYWVSQWAGKTLREGRHSVYQMASDEALGAIAARHGLDYDTVKAAMPEVARYQSAAKTLLEQGETYISERAARMAAIRVYEGAKHESKAIRDEAMKGTRDEKRGRYGESVVVIPDVDGQAHIMLQDLRLMPGLAPDPSKAVLLSQTRRFIPTIDFQALDGQLMWWKWAHRPERLAPNPTAGDVFKAAGRRTLAGVARTKAQWDKLITASDFAMMVWKASALLRPAQTPRNLADDVLRRMLVFGNLPLMMSLMRAPRRIYQNVMGQVQIIDGRRTRVGGRGELLHDFIAESLTRSRASRRTKLDVDAELDFETLRKRTLKDKVREVSELLEGGKFDEAHQELRQGLLAAVKPGELPPDLGRAWVEGIIGWDDFGPMLEQWAASPHLSRNLGEIQRVIQAYREGMLGVRVEVTSDNVVTTATDAALAEAGAKVTKRDDKVTTKAIFSRPEERKNPFSTSLEPPKSEKIRQIEQDREFKRLVLMHYFGQNGRSVRFLESRPVVEPKASLESGLPEWGHSKKKPKAESEKERKARERRASYISDWIQRVAAEHVRSVRVSPGRTGDAKTSYAPGHILVNPFDGELTKWDPDDYTIIKHHNLHAPINQDGTTNLLAIQNLEHYILQELDDLMRPNGVLSLQVDTSGNIRMGVALYRKPEARVRPLKQGSAGFRLKNFWKDGIADAGHTAFNIRLRDGRSLTLRAAFDGPQGEDFMHRISARGGAGTWQYLVGDFSPNRLLDAEGGWGIVRPGEKGYKQSWERAVNAQLAGDEVAQMFLRGKTQSDVISWAESTPEGSSYINRLHHLGTNYVNHIRQVSGIVDIYVPYQDSAAGRHLRDAVADQVATYDDLAAVVGDGVFPEVHGASLRYNLGRGAIFKQVAYGVDRAQKILSDLPTDKASRFPFFAEAYRRHLTDLVRMADDNNAYTQGVISVEDMTRFERQARERALYDTKYYLYDVSMMNDVARLTRLIVPFSSAIMDSYIKYSRIVRDTAGGAVLQGLYYWDMFERNEMVQDENGYALKKDADGSDAWYQIDPETKEMTRVPDELVGKQRYVQFRLPSDLGKYVGKKYFGVETAPVFVVNQKSFNVFLDLPSTGPLVAIPANQFSLDHPEFAESDVIRKFVLPFGPSTDWTKVGVPSTVRTAWESFVGEDGARAEAQAKAIFQAELIAYAREERDNPPTIQEARARAASMQGLRFASAWITPVSFQVASPYQPYIDTYRQMVREDPDTADEKFLTRYGDDFYAVAMSTTRNNAGMTATLSSQKAFENHKNLVAAFPELAGLITGADGGAMAQMLYKDSKEQGKYTAFSKAVYETQKITPIRPGSDKMIREVMSLDESVQELEKRRVWDQFKKMMDVIDAEMVDRGLTRLAGRRAADLIARRDGFIEQNRYWLDPGSGMQVVSPWYADYSQNDSRMMQNRIDAMWQIVQDPDLQKRDDIRGLVEYLDAREEMQERMGRMKLKTLTAAKAKRLASEWDAISFRIREANPMFAPVWARYLSHDNTLAK